MKKITFTLAVLCSALVFSCNNSETTDNSNQEATTETKMVQVTLAPKSESTLAGDIVFTQEGDEVTMQVAISGVPEGEHAIHIHEVPDCSAPDGSSAGGHWNPAMKDHGQWGEMAHHAGDIGNLVVDAEGKASLTFKTDKWCIGCEDSTMNILNHSVIIHAGVDDFTTQPTGNAGGRVGCGVIE